MRQLLKYLNSIRIVRRNAEEYSVCMTWLIWEGDRKICQIDPESCQKNLNKGLYRYLGDTDVLTR